MTKCTKEVLRYPGFDRRRIEASFGGGEVSSDAGVMLLRQVDRKLGLTQAIDEVIEDKRHPLLIEHQQIELLRQRIYGLAFGYEDLNDHDTLRKDGLWQTAMNRSETLASSPT